MSDRISVIARAKLNLYLDITGRRSDGYHLLETVMQSVSLSDTVHIGLCGSGISVTCDNPDIPQNGGNICDKAARLFFEEINRPLGANIAIEKRIPHGAGMGGGSADAAAVLRGLNVLCGLPVSEKRLLELGLMCGADVPFCMVGGTKLCRGIGEEMSDIPDIANGYSFLVVMPDFTCPTGEAYRKWDASPLPIRGKLNDFLEEGMECPENMYNVFETLYADKRIEKIRRMLLIEGRAKAAGLTGSGAALFGVFPDDESAKRAEKLFGGFTAVCSPCGAGTEFLKE